MSVDVNRREFVGTAVAGGVFSIVPRHVLGGPGRIAPSEKIKLAHIGMGTQGFRELGTLLEDPRIQITAVCDPNTDSNDYIEWGKNGLRKRIRSFLGDPNWREGIAEGAPGGREVGRLVVDTYYARNRAEEKHPACRAYADFRALLDQEPDLDAVKIMTPDHLHATISVAAMRKGKHVIVHKPIANRLHEGRLVVEAARKSEVATLLLAYGSGGGNRIIAQQVKRGVIGTLREIHNWTNRPVWPQYAEIPTDRPPIPKGFDWDLWLGPATDRPYHPHYTHTVFRGWYDFGGGSMADMGIYSLWPVFEELGLGVATTARAWATHTCAIQDYVSRPRANDFAYPIGCQLRFQFAAQAGRPPVNLFWYDGGMKPRLPAEVEARDVELGREGILFVGDEGCIIGGFHGQGPQLVTKGTMQPLSTDGTASSRDGDRLSGWIKALREGGQSPGSFLHAGAITDTVNLGTVALRAGKKVVFDSAKMEITNVTSANRFLRREYRPGWEI